MNKTPFPTLVCPDCLLYQSLPTAVAGRVIHGQQVRQSPAQMKDNFPLLTIVKHFFSCASELLSAMDHKK